MTQVSKMLCESVLTLKIIFWQVCAAVGLCDQGRLQTGTVSQSRKLMAEGLHKDPKLKDDTFCQFCTMAVSYIKVGISHINKQ